MPHGLDTKIFRPAPLPKEPDLVLAVGRLTPKKGFDTLVQACGLLRDQGRRFRCVILGEGRLGQQLARTIEQLDLGHYVRLHDFVPHQELPDWYRRACMLVLPARVLSEGNRDGIPNVVLESLATGTPVASTPVGGIPAAGQDFRDTNEPLVQRFAKLTETRLARSLQRVSAAA
ncbi:MAG: glycosyltransferase [Acidobacteria bacterium]|nr:glycosyltransferase [Acidobacteriota bacterium]